MICNILSKMNEHPRFKLLEKCEQVVEGKNEGYMKLTDNIINWVEEINAEEETDPETKKNVQEAQMLLKRIKKRDIYRFVKSSQTFFDEDLSDGSENAKNIKKVFDKERIKDSILKFHQGKLNSEDVFIVQGEVTFGMKNKNPMNLVKFFNKGEPHEHIVDIPPEQFSLLYTKSFVEKYICVYITEDNLEQFNLVKEAFTNYIEENNLYAGN